MSDALGAGLALALPLQGWQKQLATPDSCPHTSKIPSCRSTRRLRRRSGGRVFHTQNNLYSAVADLQFTRNFMSSMIYLQSTCLRGHNENTEYCLSNKQTALTTLNLSGAMFLWPHTEASWFHLKKKFFDCLKSLALSAGANHPKKLSATIASSEPAMLLNKIFPTGSVYLQINVKTSTFNTCIFCTNRHKYVSQINQYQQSKILIWFFSLKYAQFNRWSDPISFFFLHTFVFVSGMCHKQ